MKQYKLLITLDSDLSPGSGDSISGLIDHEITHEHGIPIIPAKRLKGALRHMAKEFFDWGYTTNEAIERLFGKIGEEKSSGFKIYDAVLYQIPKGYFESNEKITIENYNCLLQGLQQKNPNDLLALWTMVYTKTAIHNDSGQAKTGSLRSLRVINRGLVFKSTITLENEGDAKLLEDCVKALRHLGYGRTRGLGEVTCQLLSVKQKNAPINSAKVAAEQPFRITLKQPVLLAGNEGLYGSCTDFIPGSALLGVFASLYIHKHQLQDNAHKDETFARLFLRGAVSFGYAYPEIENKVFTPCPLHIQREKHGSFAYGDGFEQIPLVRKINQMAFIDDDTLLLHEPKKEMRMHHARPANRRIGRALNDAEEANNNQIIGDNKGQFYYYTALSRGQSFVGTLRGEQEDIKLLMELLAERDNTIQLGRSRTAEYGEATMTALPQSFVLTKKYKAAKNEKKVAIYFETPLAFQDETGRYVLEPQLLIEEMERKLGVSFTIEKSFFKQTTLKGYNAKWRLPKQEKVAFDAGTVLIVSTQENIDWTTVEKTLWGSDLAQGCGKVQVLTYEGLAKQFPVKNEQWQLQKIAMEHDEALSQIEVALCTRHQKELDKKAAIDAAKKFMKKPEIKAIGQTKLHQLTEFFISEKPKYKKERFIKKGEALANVFKELEKEVVNKSSDFKKIFFHTLKLEVRANGNE
ncbi:RAMP superfamily CRISPR-associated protein [Lysinibacillus sp. FSL H8-0500]|uniref:RAMP superfamily CRISPR-associated protein n=1 Tax=Lysinibacillus sp. FSL H8-0500 TaxID=2921393 RepID=UPI0031011E07